MRWIVLAAALSLAAAAARAEPAEDHWTTAHDPELAAALARAQEMIEREAFGAALPLLRGLSQDAPANADVFNLLGFALRKTGDLDASGRAYAQALHLQPNHLGALEYQGELFLTLGDVDAAEANLRRLASLCAAPCEERAELQAAIDAWRAAHSN